MTIIFDTVLSLCFAENHQIELTKILVCPLEETTMIWRKLTATIILAPGIILTLANNYKTRHKIN
jgi:hypothetical protein